MLKSTLQSRINPLYDAFTKAAHELHLKPHFGGYWRCMTHEEIVDVIKFLFPDKSILFQDEKVLQVEAKFSRSNIQVCPKAVIGPCGEKVQCADPATTDFENTLCAKCSFGPTAV